MKQHRRPLTATSFSDIHQKNGKSKNKIDQLVPIHVVMSSARFESAFDKVGVDQGIDTMDPFPEMVSPTGESSKRGIEKKNNLLVIQVQKRRFQSKQSNKQYLKKPQRSFYLDPSQVNWEDAVMNKIGTSSVKTQKRKTLQAVQQQMVLNAGPSKHIPTQEISRLENSRQEFTFENELLSKCDVGISLNLTEQPFISKITHQNPKHLQQQLSAHSVKSGDILQELQMSHRRKTELNNRRLQQKKFIQNAKIQQHSQNTPQYQRSVPRMTREEFNCHKDFVRNLPKMTQQPVPKPALRREVIRVFKRGSNQSVQIIPRVKNAPTSPEGGSIKSIEFDRLRHMHNLTEIAYYKPADLNVIRNIDFKKLLERPINILAQDLHRLDTDLEIAEKQEEKEATQLKPVIRNPPISVRYSEPLTDQKHPFETNTRLFPGSSKHISYDVAIGVKPKVVKIQNSLEKKMVAIGNNNEWKTNIVVHIQPELINQTRRSQGFLQRQTLKRSMLCSREEFIKIEVGSQGLQKPESD